MSSLDTVIASLSGTQLSLAGLLRWLNAQGRLQPLVREALAAQVIQEHAQKAGLTVTAEELQTVADLFRQKNGLHTAKATHAWLAARGLSADHLETGLADQLLAGKFKEHTTGPAVAPHFAAHQADYEQLRFAELVLGREDLARELASQVREEGRELGQVAQEQRLALRNLQAFRKDLHGPLAAALNSAKAGHLIGPVGTARGFALVLIEARKPPELDPPTRTRIQDELFGTWLAGMMREAKIDLAGTS